MKLHQDSRDLHIADHFGSVSIIPDIFELEKGLSNPTELTGSVMCTAISASDVCTNQTGELYDTDILWSQTPKNSGGATPQDSMGALIKNGLTYLGKSRIDNRWTSYFRSEGISGDYFVTTQNSILSTNSSTTVACGWYNEWTMVPPDGIMPRSMNRSSGHDFEITGWKIINNEPHFHVKPWFGYMMWMPKSVYNEEMDKYGTSAWIPTILSGIQQSKRTLWQWIQDMLINLSLLVQTTSPVSGFPPKLYIVAKNALGTHQTLNTSVDPEVGCAEALSAIIKNIGIPIPVAGIAGTAQLEAWLMANPRFVQITEPEVGAIIMSATSNIGKVRGHCGVIAMFDLQYKQDWGIMSNSSDTGLLMEQWSLNRWIAYYQNYGGLDIKYFRLI